jgi:effector-binding domain-containing protein
MSTTTKHMAPNQRAFNQVLNTIRELAKELSIGLTITGHRIHVAVDGVSKLNPVIQVSNGDVSLKIWEKSLVRTYPEGNLAYAINEGMYADAYDSLVEWVVKNDLIVMLRNRNQEAFGLNQDLHPPQKSFAHTPKERVEEIECAVPKFAVNRK